ncbi:MAG: hypothetical protein QOC81_1030 [Thermoanaerobaculia bacterium]|jgi:hypothetical protein|nr:hypothetical protein [Thermoanaerobaculia bacterium]
MRNEIVLIGPLSAGKTSVALYVSTRLRKPNYPLDRIKWYYRFRNGYDLARGTVILRSAGFAALLEYAKPYFSMTDLKRFLEEFKGGVIDFGASHSVFEDRGSLWEAQHILKPFINVVLLLPTPDPHLNISILSERIRQRYSERERTLHIIESYVDVNKRFVLSPSNATLAKHTVYTEGKTVEETGEEVIAKCGLTPIGNIGADSRDEAGFLESAVWSEARAVVPPFA